MKIECSKEVLIDSISIAEKTTGKNLTLPVLGCLLLDATEEDVLKIRATNIDLGIEVKVPAKITEPAVGASSSGRASRLGGRRGIL